MLIVKIERLRYVLKMLGPEHPRITYGVVLIKNVLREHLKLVLGARLIISNYKVSFINLYYKASGFKKKILVAFLIHKACLRIIVVMNYFPNLEAVFICKAVVASNHVRPCFLGSFYKSLVIIRNNPVIRINKAKPLSLCPGKADVLGPSLMKVNR